MENFEPGTRCPWTTYTFSVNDRGRKCPRCERVITLTAWQEKQRCFCGNTSLVEAVAGSSAPTRISRTTHPQPRSATSSSPTVSRPTGTTASSFQNTSPTAPANSIPSSPGYSPANDSFSSGCGCFTLLLLFIILSFGTCTSQSKQQSRTRMPQPQESAQLQNNPSQNYPSWNFPRSKCGDSNPPGLQNFYPVFVNRTDNSTFLHITSNYCRDAYLMTRTSVNQKAIQVASFTSKERAFELSQIMLRDPRVKSAEVGSPSQR